jgi:protoheme IX farnesyltransferase
VCTITLVLCSLLPTVLGFTTAAYAVVAGIAGTWFLVRSIRFLDPATRDSEARQLFFASIAYLPILLAALVIDRILLV